MTRGLPFLGLTTPLQDFFPSDFDFETPQNMAEREEENRAYQEGWVRGSLLHQFVSPTYVYIKSVFCVIPTDETVREICTIYRDNWIPPSHSVRTYLESARLSVTMSPYGIASVRLEIPVPIAESAIGQDGVNEFRYVQKALTPLFSSGAAANKLRTFSHYPSFLSFIALSAIWKFMKGLKEKMSACEWWKNAGDLLGFDKVWGRSTTRPFPLRHETTYYYFESHRYGQGDGSVYSDGIIQLGLSVSSNESGGSEENARLFSMTVKENLRNRDLCVTDNGFAYVAGASLVVAVKPEQYMLQGAAVTEKDYWRWMFRLLCCMRECFILCDIGSRNVHRLRERYESAREECFPHGTPPSENQEQKFIEKSLGLLDELAQVASLLFTVEEASHSVTASRVPFVQEKLRTFVDHLGLSDLLENVNKRRQRLEERLHDEMSRVSQGQMERLTKNSFHVSVASGVIAFLSMVIAVVSIWVANTLDGKHADFEKKQLAQESSLATAITNLSCKKAGNNPSKVGNAPTNPLQSTMRERSVPIAVCFPQPE
jgi:hypothetical protein